MIYKIASRTEWQAAEEAGQFDGSAVDLADGFIHFSTAEQMKETAAKHFAGQSDLLLIAIDDSQLDIIWEPSRGGALFPHLYQPLPLTAVAQSWPLPLGPDGVHQFPDESVLRLAHIVFSIKNREQSCK